jgi:manganese-dependent inorganic pyrophosphatase
MSYFIVGHRSPDTDAVVSAIAFEEYLKKDKIKAEAIIIGKPNRETEFVLKKFKQKSPESFSKALLKSKFYLVDHGGVDQSIPGLKEDDIMGVIDHHQMTGLKTTEPIFYRCEPIGSTSSLIAKMFWERGWVPSKKTASLLASGIISDTLNLTSKTATREDRLILKKLSQIANIDSKSLSKEMFRAKSDISGMDLKKIILNDFKDYEHKGKKIGIGVFETVDPKPFNQEKEKILDILDKIKISEGYDFLFFGSVDIIKRKTYLYLVSKEEMMIAQRSFNLVKIESLITLDGVTSRKKELVPFIFKSIR